MIVYRIGHPEYVQDLSGHGSSVVGGRWNSVGERIVYTAETSSLAILELLGYLKGIKGQIPYGLIKIDTGKTKILHLNEITGSLPHNWAHGEAGRALTRKIGGEWLQGQQSPILKVPSVHNPIENNYLLNPKHPDLKINVIDEHWYLYDDRLTEKTPSSDQNIK
ncbi:RES family NAD+ phosphorylase [Fulvivirgaceae bacterium BMA10]|uniref:RES family NAD+ phosphorylase n=1 Tax=Splendidivirga corallicola TaxID=3051826 RepID=A0ABT8KJZ7_9BACT|nr:RES family NAD+ phosphorylase [Fulvivirgaceae bacterium BMA10]